MSDQNSREDSRVLLKKITSFNVENNFYQKDQKDEIVRDIKKLLFIDEPVVRQFLAKWLNKTKEVAREFDLLGTEVEVDKTEEEESAEKEGAEKDKTEEEDQKDKAKGDSTTSNQETQEPAEEETTAEAPAEKTIPKLPESKIYNSYLKRASQLMLNVLDD